jgi:hypothetical protein
LSELFGVEVQTINHHLKKIYKSGELLEVATIQKKSDSSKVRTK